MVFKPCLDIKVDVPKISLGEWILREYRKKAAEGKTALVWADKGTEISYGDLLRDAVRVATGFKAMGVKSGETMAVVAKNSPELFPSVIGCLFAGIKVAASVPELSADELRSNFNATKPSYILTAPEKAPVVQDAISGLDPKPQIIVLEDKNFKDILAKGSHANPDTFETAPIDDPLTHVFAYMFSSGTTGKQKAIEQSDYNFVESGFVSAAPMFQKRGLLLCASQPSWISWYYMLMRSVITDRTWLYTTANDAHSILDFMHKYKPTTYICPPSVIYGIRDLMEKYPGRWDTTSVKDIIAAGDRFLAVAQKELSEQIKIDIYQEYGSTEIGYVSVPDVDEKPPVYGSAGKLAVPIRLVNIDTGEEITEANQVGEVRGFKTVMRSYLGNPQATAEAFDEQGCYKMGDLAYLDDKGNLFIVDRIKEMLKYKGFQVTPSELEEIIRLIPGVYDAAVAGKHHPVAGSLLTAFVVKKPGANLTENDIKNFMATKNLHDAKQLRGGVLFIDEIPKNSNGKLQRVKLSEMLNGTPTQNMPQK